MQNLEKSIIEKLPQIPYVIDQVGDALTWARESLDEGEYMNLLELTYDVADFTTRISDPSFYKTHYVVATILSSIENAKTNEKFSKFDSASKSVEQTLTAITIDPNSIEENGCFKSIMKHLVPLANQSMDLFTIGLMGVKHSLKHVLKGLKEAQIKTPITGNDYITVLGYALVIANIRMANISMSNEAHKVFNEISIMLNKDVNY